jgi:hypothetical protein
MRNEKVGHAVVSHTFSFLIPYFLFLILFLSDINLHKCICLIPLPDNTQQRAHPPYKYFFRPVIICKFNSKRIAI